jgi:hypothetical protein
LVGFGGSVGRELVVVGVGEETGGGVSVGPGGSVGEFIIVGVGEIAGGVDSSEFGLSDIAGVNATFGMKLFC